MAKWGEIWLVDAQGEACEIWLAHRTEAIFAHATHDTRRRYDSDAAPTRERERVACQQKLQNPVDKQKVVVGDEAEKQGAARVAGARPRRQLDHSPPRGRSACGLLRAQVLKICRYHIECLTKCRERFLDIN